MIVHRPFLEKSLQRRQSAAYRTVYSGVKTWRNWTKYWTVTEWNTQRKVCRGLSLQPTELCIVVWRHGEIEQSIVLWQSDNTQRKVCILCSQKLAASVVLCWVVWGVLISRAWRLVSIRCILDKHTRESSLKVGKAVDFDEQIQLTNLLN